MKLFTFLIFTFLLTDVFSQKTPNCTSKNDTLYPSKDLIIKYHTDWAKENYPKRIIQFQKSPLEKENIVFLGNSITQLGRDWSERFNIPGIKNRGIAGDVTDGVLARLNEIIYFKPTAVFILIGINDIYNLHDKKEIPSAEYIANNIIKIANILKKESPETNIYIETILPTSHKYLRKYISKVNNIIQHDIPNNIYEVIDLHTVFVNSKGLMREDLTVDGTHLNEKGYDTWVNYIKSTVLKNTIESVKYSYPDGKRKALIMSFDDGIEDDYNLVKLFNDNNIIGTFNLSSGYLGTEQIWKSRDGKEQIQKYVPTDSLLSVYKNHEIASHGALHKNLTKLSDKNVIEEITSDINNLNNLTGRNIKSFAFPYGSTNAHVDSLIKLTSLTNARTVKSTFTFQPPVNYLHWDPTCKDNQTGDLLDDYLALKDDSMSLFFVWGHSWELRDKSRWQNISLFCKKIGNRDDIWYVGCSDYESYMNTFKSIIISGKQIKNTSKTNSVCLQINGKSVELQPNEIFYGTRLY